MHSLRFLGLPIHPMLVHFPIALWALAPLADGIYLVTGATLWWQLGYGAAAAGVLAALPAMAFGFADFLLLPAKSEDAQLATRHMSWMAGAWTLFALKVSVLGYAQPTLAESIAGACFDCVGLLVLAVGGHLGGRLVYERGVGYRDSVRAR